MRKRPLCLVWAGLMLVIWILKAAGAPVFGAPHLAPQDCALLNGDMEKAYADELPEGGARLVACGTVKSRKETEKSFQYVLKDVQITQISRSASGHFFNSSGSDDRDSRSVYFPYLLFITEKETVCRIGACVQGTGRVERIEAAGNPGQFDARHYYACMKIYYRMRCEKPEVIRSGGGFAEWTALLRNRLTRNLKRLLPEESAGVLAGMLLGERVLLDDEIRRDYQIGGIMHILAISGLHISMLGMGLFMLLQYLFIPMPAAAGMASLFMIVYCALVGNPSSAVRAIVMFTVTMGAWISRRSYDLLSALALSGILILVSNPGYLFLSGFQLSFAAVMGTAAADAVMRALKTAWREAKIAEGEAPDAAGPLLCRISRTAVQAAGSYLILTAVTMPLVAYHYYEIPLLGFLANLLILPMTGPVLALGAAGCAASLFSFFLAGVILFPVHICLLLSGGVLHLLRRVPGSVWICGQPEIFQIAVYYILLTAALVLLCMPRNTGGRDAAHREAAGTGKTHFSVRRAGLRAAVLTAAAIMILMLRRQPAFSFTVLDVGQGDGLVLQSRAQAVFLIDGGSTSVDQVGKYRLIPYLKSQGIHRIDGIWISHEDLDHISGVIELLESVADGSLFIQVDVLYLPAWMDGTESGALFETLCEKAGTDVRYVARGDSLKAGGMRIRVLYPLRASTLGGNEGSMVLHVSYQQFDLLLTGDLEGEGEEKLLAAEEHIADPEILSGGQGDAGSEIPNGQDNLQEQSDESSSLQAIDCLKIAHHGSKNASTECFLDLTQPEIAVISAGKNNRYGHPHEELLERLKDRGTEVFRTDLFGALKVTTDGKKVRVETYL